MPAPSQPIGVEIEIRGNRPGLWLESRRRFTDEPWTVICHAPCNRTVDVADRSLRISGQGVRPSNPFFIDGRGGHELIVASAGDAVVNAWGQRCLIGGIGLGLASGAAYGLGKVRDSEPAVVGGLVGMIAGGALVALALPLLGASSTHVRNSKGERVGSSGAVLVW